MANGKISLDDVGDVWTKGEPISVVLSTLNQALTNLSELPGGEALKIIGDSSIVQDFAHSAHSSASAKSCHDEIVAFVDHHPFNQPAVHEQGLS